MDAILIIAVIAAALMVVVSLGRGLFHFSQSHHAEGADGVLNNQLMQNRMMMARIKWQAITIIILILIGVVAAGR